MIRGAETEDGGGCVLCQEVASHHASYYSNKKDYVCRIEARGHK